RLEPGDRLHLRDRLPPDPDDRLGHLVVGRAEGHGLRPDRLYRDLGEVEVARLLPRRGRGYGRKRRPGDPAARATEPLPRRVGDRRLVALAAVRVRDLERLLLGAAPPRWERWVVRPDRELPGGEEMEVARCATGDRCRGRRATGCGRRNHECSERQTEDNL